MWMLFYYIVIFFIGLRSSQSTGQRRICICISSKMFKNKHGSSYQNGIDFYQFNYIAFFSYVIVGILD